MALINSPEENVLIKIPLTFVEHELLSKTVFLWLPVRICTRVIEEISKWPPLQNFDRDLGKTARMSASIFPARLPRSHQNLSKSQWQKTCQDLKISAAKNLQRSHNLSSRKLTKNLCKISSKISVRSQSLGSQKCAENLGETCQDIKILEAKTSH